MNYSSALQYLQTFSNFERIPFDYREAFNLRRMRLLLGVLGHPERKFRCVLVAGTKGKGSTAKFLSSILSAHGLTVGLYTSPHLSDPRERIQVNGRLVSKNEFADVVSQLRAVLHRQNLKQPITYFEAFTLLAVLYFAKRRVQFGIFEIGMGGRLDATNALDPQVSVITPISFDHEEYLGRTLSEIACEKTAIMRPNRAVVIGKQCHAVEQVIKREAARKHARLFSFGRDFNVSNVSIFSAASQFDFEINKKAIRKSIRNVILRPQAEESNRKILKILRFAQDDRIALHNLKIRLPGQFQVENVATALMAAIQLEQETQFGLSEVCVRKGLRDAFWPGRFEIIKHCGRTIVLDGAHNDASMRSCAETVKKLFPKQKCVTILGISREKNLCRTLPPLLNVADALIVTKSNNPRAQEPAVIIRTAYEMGFERPVFWTAGFADAWTLSKRMTNANSIVLVTGSLFLVGEAREYFKCRTSI